MYIRLRWTSRTPANTKTVIYRSTDPFDENDLPDPIGEVGPGVTEFLDKGLVYGEYYYYRTQVFKDEEHALSKLKRIRAVTYTGPGPQEIENGDSDYGYFGLVSEFELLRATLFNSKYQEVTGNRLTVQVPYNSARDGHWYAKFAFEGRIIYIPLWVCYSSGTSLNSLKESGLAAGLYKLTEPYASDETYGEPVVINSNGVRLLMRLAYDNVRELISGTMAFRRPTEFYEAFLSTVTLNSKAFANRLVRRPEVYPSSNARIDWFGRTSHSQYLPGFSPDTGIYFLEVNGNSFNTTLTTSRACYVPLVLELLPEEPHVVIDEQETVE